MKEASTTSLPRGAGVVDRSPEQITGDSTRSHIAHELDSQRHVGAAGPSGRQPDCDAKAPADGIWDEERDMAMMGGYGSLYTDADKRMMARYIVSKGDRW